MDSRRLRFLNNASTKKFSSSDILALFAVVTFGLHLITLLGLFLLYGSYSQLSKKASPSLVQLETGKSIKVAAIGSNERTPQVVLRFVSDTMTFMMNWSGNLNAGTIEESVKPLPDPGIEIRSLTNSQGKVTSSAWQASHALSEDFRKEFLKKLSQITPQGVFKGKTQVVLVPISIQSPIKISSGKWKIKMIANLTIFDQGSSLGEIIPFNKEIFVQAVEAPEYPGKIDGLTAVIYQIRSSGLEIYAIRDLQQDNL